MSPLRYMHSTGSHVTVTLVGVSLTSEKLAGAADGTEENSLLKLSNRSVFIV